MFGRRAARLLWTPASSRLPASLWSPCHHNASLIALPIRAYSTPGRPKKAVGEPSRPVKRGVKRVAANASAADGAAKPKKQPARTKDAVTIKAIAPKKPTTAKPAAKKAAPKKKKKAAKPALTEAQTVAATARLAKRQANNKVREDKNKATELKKLALDPPKVSNNNAWMVFFTEKMSSGGARAAGTTRTRTEQQAALSADIREAAVQWKTLSSSDLEHYNHLAHTKKDAELAAYKRWVESHSPDVIERANKARASLRRILTSAKRNLKWRAIDDERAVKRGITPYIQFFVNRNASGDFKNIVLPERAKLIGQEWRALSADEKEKYKDLYSKDRARYTSEYKTVHGHVPGLPDVELQAAAAAA